MILIIAGSRHLNFKLEDFEKVLKDNNLTPSLIISGGCRGIDSYGEIFALHNKIPLQRINADWNGNGKAAGPIRNEKMAKLADALLLIWDGKSRGSANMKKNMEDLGKKVYEVIIVS